MINWSAQYTNVQPPSTGYEYGSAKNETTAGALDGTPLEKAGYDDLIGMMTSIVVAAGLVPNGNSESSTNPQILQALVNMRWYDKIDYTVGTKVVGSDGATYTCLQANGPTTSVQDPTTETAPRTIWATEIQALTQNTLYRVGSYWMSDDPTEPQDILGFGTWERVLGRMLVGLSEGDSDYDTPGETGGSKSHMHNDSFSVDGHVLTEAQLPSHSHRLLGNLTGGDFTEPLAGKSLTGESTAGTAAAYTNSGFDGTSAAQLVEDTGGGLSHNHGLSGSVSSTTTVPPYMTTYIWKRTA